MSDLVLGITAADRRQTLLDAADSIAAYKLQQKDLADVIADVKAKVVVKCGLHPKALDVALKYLMLSEGERLDVDTALTLAQQALNEGQTGDLFAAQLEHSTQMHEASRAQRRRERNPADH